MFDFNGDGKVDFKDYYIYTNFIDTEGDSNNVSDSMGFHTNSNYVNKASSRRCSKQSGMGGFFTVLIIACVLGGINELLGSAVLLGYIIYQILN